MDVCFEMDFKIEGKGKAINCIIIQFPLQIELEKLMLTRTFIGNDFKTEAFIIQ